MKTFSIKQKFWSWGGKFEIFDEVGIPTYQVEGSVFKWLKEFTVSRTDGTPVSKIKNEFSLILPRFTVTMADGSQFTIQKEFTWFKDRYTISGFGLDVQGDWWDMNFSILRNGATVATISQEWLTLTSTYHVTVYEEELQDLVMTLVIAIDYVKEMNSAAASSAST